MSEQLSPPERDRAPGGPLPSAGPSSQPSRGGTWLWIVVGIVVLLSLGAGAIAGYIAGRVHERTNCPVVIVPPQPPVITPSDLPEGFFLVEGGLAFVYPPDFYAFSNAYPFMGVTLAERSDGVFLSEVFANGPADLAGLQTGDRIIAVASQLTNTSEDLQAILADYAPGEAIDITIERSRSLEDVFLTLGGYIPFERSSGSYDVQLPPPVPPPPLGDAYLGVGWRTLTQDDAFGVGEGILVVEVYPNSPADLAGLQPGDIITRFDGIRITNVSSLDDLLRSHAPGDVVELRVWRGDRTEQIQVRLG